jgi:hypothetical protein
MEVNSDFRDLLLAFNSAGVRYLVVGGLALAFHDKPRFTKDLDIWIDPTPKNAEAAYRALADFGAPLDKLGPTDLAKDDVVFQIGVAPLRIDIMTSITGVSFSEAWASKASASYGDVAATIIGREQLLVNKRATGRLQDLADIESLERPRD